MYRLGVSDDFSAAHFIDGYAGSCEAVHGHNYRAEAIVEVEDLDEIGMGVDFRQLKKYLRQVLRELDHCLLNESPHFKNLNPSSENIARFIFENLYDKLRASRTKLIEVKVWETPDSWASYNPGNPT